MYEVEWAGDWVGVDDGCWVIRSNGMNVMEIFLFLRVFMCMMYRRKQIKRIIIKCWIISIKALLPMQSNNNSNNKLIFGDLNCSPPRMHSYGIWSNIFSAIIGSNNLKSRLSLFEEENFLSSHFFDDDCRCRVDDQFLQKDFKLRPSTIASKLTHHALQQLITNNISARGEHTSNDSNSHSHSVSTIHLHISRV